MMTGSFDDNSSNTKKPKEYVRAYFERLGYEVDLDFNLALDQEWWQIMRDGKLIVQIDKGVPLDDIVMDICQFHQGKLGISKSDYELRGPDSPEMTELFKKVYDDIIKCEVCGKIAVWHDQAYPDIDEITAACDEHLPFCGHENCIRFSEWDVFGKRSSTCFHRTWRYNDAGWYNTKDSCVCPIGQIYGLQSKPF
jgi:hypothetical protein